MLYIGENTYSLVFVVAVGGNRGYDWSQQGVTARENGWSKDMRGAVSSGGWTGSRVQVNSLCRSSDCTVTLVVCHLLGQTGRVTVWTNGKQNSGLVISSRNRDYHLHKWVPFTKKPPLRPETVIKYGFEEMENEFSDWNIPTGFSGNFL